MIIEVWRACAEYDDGSEVDKFVPYTAHGNYEKECEEQYDIERELIEVEGKTCTFYSVEYWGEEEV